MCFFKCDVNTSKLCPFSLGMAVGLVKGLWMLGLAWAGWLGGYGMVMIEEISKFHHSYGPTLMGGVVGGFSGLICGFIIGFVVAMIYNLCLRCCCRKAKTL